MKSGRRTLQRQKSEHWLHLLQAVIRATQRPLPPQLVSQDEAGRWLPVEPDEDGGFRFVTEVPPVCRRDDQDA